MTVAPALSGNLPGMAFSEAFEKAWQKSMDEMGTLLGGCGPWALVISLVLLLLVGMCRK